jgi:fatty-acyl-CoA synthase
MNLTELIARHADRHPDALALSAGDVSLDYSQLLRRAQRTAGALRSVGVGRGDIVAVVLRNGLDFIDVMCGAAQLGAIFMPLNWRLAPEELRYICGHAGADVVVSSAETCSELATDGDGRRWVSTQASAGRWPSLAELLSDSRPVEQPSPVTERDVHRLMYTSGTSARPKGVPISYGNLYWKCSSQLVELEFSRNDKGLVCAPLFHVGALDLTLTNMLYVGGSTHILDGFRPAEFLAAIDRHDITNVWLAPAMIATLLRSQELVGTRYPSVRFLGHGGERMSERTLDALETGFPSAWVADAYGLTETVSCDTFLSRERVRDKRGSLGKAALHARIRIVDPAGEPVPAGQRGEIAVSGPKVCREYWKDPEATAAAFHDGWLHTGDIGYLDDEGFLYLLDRLKDVIRSGSENVASLEVERVIREHPGIDEVAVVGRPDARWGEVPVAVVVVRQGFEVLEAELAAFCRERLAGFKVPAAFRFMDVLPRNSAGKVLKQVLRERERGERTGSG